MNKYTSLNQSPETVIVIYILGDYIVEWRFEHGSKFGEKADKELKKLGKDADEGLKKIGKDIDKGVKKLSK